MRAARRSPTTSTQNAVSKKFHSNICKAKKKVTATGTVEEKDGKMVLTASKIELGRRQISGRLRPRCFSRPVRCGIRHTSRRASHRPPALFLSRWAVHPEPWSLLIVGASARSAAYSTRRAGGRPSCVDLFADRDLAAICPAARLAPRDYPDGLARLAAEAPASPWMYTGALENHPELVDRIAAVATALGQRRLDLCAVRDPIAVAESLGLRRAAVPEGPPRVPRACRATGAGWSSRSPRREGEASAPSSRVRDPSASPPTTRSESPARACPPSSSAIGRARGSAGSRGSGSAGQGPASPIEGAWGRGRSRIASRRGSAASARSSRPPSASSACSGSTSS